MNLLAPYELGHKRFGVHIAVTVFRWKSFHLLKHNKLPGQIRKKAPGFARPGGLLLYDMWQDFLARQRAEYGDEDRDCVEADDPYSKRNFIKNIYSNVDQIFVRIHPGLRSDWRFIPFISLRTQNRGENRK